MSEWAKPVARVAIAVIVIAGVFGLGVLTGVVGSRHRPAGVLDQAAADIAANAAKPVDQRSLQRAAVQGMLGTLGDRWSSYYTPGQYRSFQQAVAGRYSGIGVWLRPGSAAGGPLEVAGVAPQSPADAAGVQVGDQLVSVGGVATAGSTVGSVVSSLRGADGTTVNVIVQRAASTLKISITRASLTIPDVSVTRLSGDVTMIGIHAFTRGVGREVRDVLAADPAAHAGGVILDLRGNPGGLLDEAVAVSSAFLNGGPVVSYERRGAPDRTLSATPGGDTTTPLVVLVDHSSASAAEVVAAAMQDRGRAVVVGERTYGKGSVQEPITLPDGSALELTVGRYLTPDGRIIDGVGVEPDVVLAASTSPEAAQQQAEQVLRGLMAAAAPLNSAG